LKKLFLTIIAITIIAGALLFPRLGDRYFWQDEANTALLAKSILKYGFPVAVDGDRTYVQAGITKFKSMPEFLRFNKDNPKGYDYVWNFQPWLMFYAPAVSFMIFGVNTFAGKFPFVLFGIGTVIIVYLLARRVTGSERTALISVAVILSSAFFLILSRQCRYYSPLMFFTTAVFYSYYKLQDSRKWGHILLAVSLTGLFHTQYVYIAPLSLALIFHAFFFRKDVLKDLIINLVIVAAVNLPWYLYFYRTNFLALDRFRNEMTAGRILTVARYYAGYFLKHMMYRPVVLLAAAVIAFNLGKIKRLFKDKDETAAFFTATSLFFVLLFLQLSVFSHSGQGRYMAAFIPQLSIILAVMFTSIINMNAVIGIVVLLVFLAGGGILKYKNELLHDYKGPLECVSEYLKEHAGPKDKVAVTYGDLPLKFYTDLKILGGESGEGNDMIKDADWVLYRKHIIYSVDQELREYMQKVINLNKYDKIVLPCSDTRFENSEDPELHRFREDINEDFVVLYRKKDGVK